MKIERINENIIRVTISLDDLEKRNISLESLSYNSPAAQELFWDMLEQAENQFGFDLSDSQLLIEPIPDLNNGFVITITKIVAEGEFESIHKYINSKLRRSDLRVKRRTKKLYSALLVYSFKDFDDLCALTRELKPIYNGESNLYKCKDTYYLMLIKNSFSVSSIKKLEVLLGEYGNRISNVNFFEGYLNEYGTKIIADNALEVLSSYF